MDATKNLIKKEFLDFGINPEEIMVERFLKYIELLLEWNKKINLTAITDVKEIIVKHFMDSASLLKVIKLKKGASVIDVGTGAGFPGVPIKILRPDINLTLLDSLNKRLVFLDSLLNEINLDATLLHSRAEEAARKKEFREKFDLVTSRAVAKMNVLSEYCLAYAKVGGIFAPLKGPAIDDELNASINAVKILGGIIKEKKSFILSDGSKRSIVIVEKISKTPLLYPRSSSKISKKSL